MFPRGLTWQQHGEVWRRAWARYRQSFAKKAKEQTQGGGTDETATDIGAAARDLAGRYFKPQTKEGMLNAAGEVLIVCIYACVCIRVCVRACPCPCPCVCVPACSCLGERAMGGKAQDLMH
jgi:hypothetical protein